MGQLPTIACCSRKFIGLARTGGGQSVPCGTVIVIFPVTAVLIILGKAVIEAWVGRKYVAGSYPVLLVVLIPTTLILAQNATPRIIYGMAKHKTLAWITSIEGVANLILSIVLVRKIGVIGDAIGTAVPLSFTALYFTPRYLSRLLGVRVWTCTTCNARLDRDYNAAVNIIVAAGQSETLNDCGESIRLRLAEAILEETVTEHPDNAADAA